jgi:prenyltransferase beta subunit
MLVTMAGMFSVFALIAPSSALAADAAAPFGQAGTITSTVETTAAQTGAQRAVTAHVVVQLAPSDVSVRAITFTEPISGLAALLRSGLDVTVAETSFGPAVCAVEGVGCPADDCFCDPSRFWSYAAWDGASWQAYQVGASQSTITATGAVEGWRWGEGEGPATAAPQAVAAVRALDWLRGQQDAQTGGYGDGLGGAIEVMLALGANRERMADWQPAGGSRSLSDFVRLRATRYSRQAVAEAGKLAVASVAAGGCRTVRSLQPAAYFSDTMGGYAADSGFNAWGILGTLALSQTVPASAVDALASQQQADGGWEWQPGFGTDTNTTALAVQTLVAAGHPITSTQIISGLAFLKSGQTPEGGFVYAPATPDFGADANSTAYALMALAAAGEDAASLAWTVDGRSAVDFLLDLQLEDGSFAWQAGSGPNLLATAQAVTALLGESYPLQVGELASCRR